MKVTTMERIDSDCSENTHISNKFNEKGYKNFEKVMILQNSKNC